MVATQSATELNDLLSALVANANKPFEEARAM